MADFPHIVQSYITGSSNLNSGSLNKYVMNIFDNINRTKQSTITLCTYFIIYIIQPSLSQGKSYCVVQVLYLAPFNFSPHFRFAKVPSYQWYFTLPHYGDVIMGMIASQITSLPIVYLIVYSGADQRKHQSSASLPFVHWPVNSPHKGPVTLKMFPFDDVIMPWKQRIS